MDATYQTNTARNTQQAHVVPMDEGYPAGNVTGRNASPIPEANPFSTNQHSPRLPVRAQSNDDIVPPSQQQYSSHLPPTPVTRLGDRDIVGRQDSRYGPVSGSFPVPPPVQLADDQFGAHRQQTADSSYNRHSIIQIQHSPRDSRAVSGGSGGYDGRNEKVATVSSRIRTTVDNAEKEREKYAAKAKLTGLALNIAIGLQVLLGSLTTGLSGVAISSGKSIAVSTTILGAFATLVASYLARARGSNEPELSIARVKDLDQFLRECKNFETDHGEHRGHDFDRQLEYYRSRFENLLGNGNEERRMSTA